jgi:SynChlorMet cassette protein ScmC
VSLFIQLVQVSLIIGQYAQAGGGLLLHGALAEKDGFGVLLAGPGEVGKTTASRRLPHPWHSLSDDMTLIVHDSQGTYWAHPWPTWSRFLFNGPRRTWNVEKALPLRAIFFLEQAQEEDFETLGTAQAICLIIESAEQASRLMSRDAGKNVTRKLRLQRFDNICALTQAIPSLVLRLSSNGAFWHTMDKALKRNEMS